MVAVLAIWALATLPQVMISVSFTVVMNLVAGPEHRYDLMSRRWSVLGATTSITVALAGVVLDRLDFPFNYQIVFLALSLGGLISYYFSSHIHLPEIRVPEKPSGVPLRKRLDGYLHLVLQEQDFVRFTIQRFVFLSGTALAVPLFPLYFVRVVKASNSAIGLISTAQSAVLLFSYFFWARSLQRRGARFVLLCATFGLALYPALMSLTQEVRVIILLAGAAGIFQAGVDLVFFDELMRTVPPEYSATFVSLSQSMQYLSAIFAPVVGTLLANQIGIGGALVVSAGLRLSGFLLFALWRGKPASAPVPLPAGERSESEPALAEPPEAD